MTTSLSTDFISNIQKTPTIPENHSPMTIEQVYDKYAPVVYGIINSLTDNTVVSDKIFTDTFLKIKDNISDFKVNGNVYPNLMRFIYKFSIQQLIHYGISPKVSNYQKESNLTYWLCTRYESLDEVASSLKISQDEAMKKIRKEYLEMNQ